MAVYTSDNALHTYKISDIIFANLDNQNQNPIGIGANDNNIFMGSHNKEDGQDVVINSEVVDAVYSDDIANDSPIGSMHGDNEDSNRVAEANEGAI